MTAPRAPRKVTADCTCAAAARAFDSALDRLLAKARPVKRRSWRCRWSNR